MGEFALIPIQRNPSLTKDVIERLRQAILRGDLEEGISLSEAQTAAKLKVSRAPVREALIELERQGLVEYDRNGRASVKHFTEEDITEILSLRSAMQAMAAGLAATRMTTEDLERLETLLSHMTAAQEMAEFSAYDSAFHDELVRIARHCRLERIWGDLRSQMELWLARLQRRRDSTQHDVRQVTLVSHREVIDVLKTRNPEAAARLVERHCSWKESSKTPELPAPPAGTSFQGGNLP